MSERRSKADLIADCRRLEAERDAARRDRDRLTGQRDGLLKALGSVANFVSSRQALALEMLAMPDPESTGGPS